MNRIDILVPERSIVIAKDLVEKNLAGINKSNVFGLFGVGSFWFPRQRHNPQDIDLAVFAQNDSQFTDEDRLKIAAPLESTFGLNVQTHIFTPYTPMVRHELAKAKLMLEESLSLYGQKPHWL